MRTPQLRPSLARLAALSLTLGLAACGGGLSGVTSSAGSGSSGAPAPAPLAGVQFPGSTYALGLIAADPATLARLPQIRHVLSTVPLPTAVDLSAKMPAVGNQGQENSCVAWAAAYALRGYEARMDVWSAVAPESGSPSVNFSPAFVYNQINGGKDGGSAIPTALTLMQQKGAATLADMPYAAGRFTVQPSKAAFADAAHYKLSTFGYIAPTDLNSMKTELAQGIPVVLAINVYANFFSLGPNEVYTGVSGALEGGHAVTIVGYNDAKGAIEIINSWGPYWGTAGYGWISYSALSKIALEAYSAIDDHGVPKPAATPTSKPGPTPTPAAKH